MLQARKIEQRVSTRSMTRMSIFACSMHDIRARARVIMISLPKRRDARSRAVHGAFEPFSV